MKVSISNQFIVTRLTLRTVLSGSAVIKMEQFDRFLKILRKRWAILYIEYTLNWHSFSIDKKVSQLVI